MLHSQCGGLGSGQRQLPVLAATWLQPTRQTATALPAQTGGVLPVGQHALGLPFGALYDPNTMTDGSWAGSDRKGAAHGHCRWHRHEAGQPASRGVLWWWVWRSQVLTTDHPGPW